VWSFYACYWFLVQSDLQVVTAKQIPDLILERDNFKAGIENNPHPEWESHY
jgi:hypothetical protein